MPAGEISPHEESEMRGLLIAVVALAVGSVTTARSAVVKDWKVALPLLG
jgi:hypothetical protein